MRGCERKEAAGGVHCTLEHRCNTATNAAYIIPYTVYTACQHAEYTMPHTPQRVHRIITHHTTSLRICPHTTLLTYAVEVKAERLALVVHMPRLGVAGDYKLDLVGGLVVGDGVRGGGVRMKG